MHDNFADWYRLAAIDLQNIDLTKRWQGIEAFSKKANKNVILDVVREAFEIPGKDQDFDGSFRAAFKKIDNAFPMRDNELEMQILAGAVIATLLNSETASTADFTALATVCANFQGLRSSVLLKEIYEACEAHLLTRSDNLRKVSKIPQFKIQQGKAPTRLDETTSPTSASINLILDPLITATFGLPDNVSRALNESISFIGNQLALQREESNMLWWLFSQYSQDLNKKLSQIDLSAACLVAGKELADLTERLPGPIAAEAFLDRMLENAKGSGKRELVIQKVIAAKPLKDWRQQLSISTIPDSLKDFCAINNALVNSIENETDWPAKFEKIAGFSAEKTADAILLSFQMYRERLLIKAFN